ISGVVFLLITLFGPWLTQKYFPTVSYQVPSLPVELCLVGIILLGSLVLGGFLTWEDESHRYRILQESHAPKLRLEFNPEENGFVFVTATNIGARACYVRVRPRTQTAVLRCRGYLESIEMLEKNVWTSVGFASRPELHWSEIHERGIVE